MSSYQDRLDPDNSLAQVEALDALLRNPLVRLLFRLNRKAPRDLSDEVARIASGMRKLHETPDRVANTVGRLGWCVHANMMVEEYRQAADLAEAGNDEAANALLDAAWNERDRLRLFTKRIVTLYEPDDERRHHRWRAVDEALRCHELSLYKGSICVLLPIIEGVIEDVTPTQNDVRFYRRGTADLLTDDTTLAGHPASLPVLSRILGESQTRTEASGRLRRNGILHGRELAYDTRVNSTKAFVALIAAIEWAQPQAQELITAASREREQRYAGSDDVDEEGRRLDRRGFVEAKDRLQRVHLFQTGRRKRGLPYTDSLAELDPAGPLADARDLTLQVDASADEYIAWICTPSSWVLGIAGRAGEFPAWLYSARIAPHGGIDIDKSWRSVVNAPSHPDW